MPQFYTGSAAPLSAELLSTLLVMAFAFLPGLGAAWGLGRRGGWDLPTVAVASFSISLCAIALVGAVAHFSGLGLAVVLWASAAILFLLWPAGLLIGRGGERLAKRWVAFPVAIGCGALALWERQSWGRGADTFYHLAAVRSLLASGRPLVTDPFFGTATRTLDPTSGIWHTALALISRATGYDVAWLYTGSGPMAAFFVVLAFWVLARRLGDSEIAAGVATVAYVVLSVYLDFRHYAQPDQISQGLAFAALAGFVLLAERVDWPSAVLAIAAGVSAAATHMAAAQLVLIAGGALLFWLFAVALFGRIRTGKGDFRPVWLVTGALAAFALLSLPLILPKIGALLSSSTATAVGSNAVRLGPFAVFSPGEEIGGGLTLFVVTAVVAVFAGASAFRKRNPRSVSALAFLALPVTVLLNPPVTTLLIGTSYFAAARIAALLRFSSYAGIAWALHVPDRTWWRRAGVLAAAGIIAAAAVFVPDQLRATFDPGFHAAVRKGSPNAVQVSREIDVQDPFGRGALVSAASIIGTGYPVVLADPVNSYHIAGLLPAAVVMVPGGHIPFIVSESEISRRSAAVSEVLDPAAPVSLRRDTLARWNVSFVLLGPRQENRAKIEGSLKSQPSLFEPALVTDTLTLYRVIGLDAGPPTFVSTVAGVADRSF